MRLLLRLSLLIFLYACVDQLDLEPSKGLESGIVVQGELIKGTPSIAKVKVSRLFNFDGASFRPIEVKSVKLIDENNQEVVLELRYSNTYIHVFSPSSSMEIAHGRSYKVAVETEDGLRIASAYEKLQKAITTKGKLKFQLDTTTVQDIKGEIKDVSTIQFLIDTPIKVLDEAKKAKLFWTAERTFKLTDSLLLPHFFSKTCYITSQLDFDNIHLLDGEALTTDEVENFQLSRVVLNHEFAEGYYYTVYQNTLTDGAFEYYSRMKELVERSGNMFEPPVGAIPSNMSNLDDPKDNNIYGYFTALSQDTLRLYISPKTVNNPSRLCPPTGIIRCPHMCCDCLIEPGSQLMKPSFWVE